MMRLMKSAHTPGWIDMDGCGSVDLQPGNTGISRGYLSMYACVSDLSPCLPVPMVGWRQGPWLEVSAADPLT